MDCINLINVEKLLFLLQRASNTFHLSKHKTNNFLPTYLGVTKIDRNHTDTHTHSVNNKQTIISSSHMQYHHVFRPVLMHAYGQ